MRVHVGDGWDDDAWRLDDVDGMQSIARSRAPIVTPSIPSADAYASEPVRYPPLVVVDIATEATAVTDEYRNQVLSQVNTSCYAWPY